MSMKRALKGRPEGAGLARGLAVCVAIPWASVRTDAIEAADASETCTNLRRVSVIVTRRSGLRHRRRRPVSFDQFVPVALALLLRGLFAKAGKPLEEVGNLGLVLGLPERLNEAVDRRLVARIELDRL